MKRCFSAIIPSACHWFNTAPSHCLEQSVLLSFSCAFSPRQGRSHGGPCLNNTDPKHQFRALRGQQLRLWEREPSSLEGVLSVPKPSQHFLMLACHMMISLFVLKQTDIQPHWATFRLEGEGQVFLSQREASTIHRLGCGDAAEQLVHQTRDCLEINI